MSDRRLDIPLLPARLSRALSRSWKPPFAATVSLLAACAPANPGLQADARSKQTLEPTFINDPAEPINRGVWAVNRGIALGIAQPTGRVYRKIVPPPARKSINHFARNATYPGRLINNSLQGRWQGAGDESVRFLTNTTVGVLGFFDVATKWGIPKSDADFAQTFSGWGWKPGTYLMLPFFGPSDEMHGVGRVADELAEPWNYGTPYTYVSQGTTVNALSDKSEDAARFIRSEADSYTNLRYAWSYSSKHDTPDWNAYGPKDAATLQTLGVTGIRLQDPEFVQKGKDTSVYLPSTGKKMKFNCWIQKQPSSLVYINPGLGSNRLSLTALVLAESLYRQGYSVVTTTSVFHPEFMESASTAALPAYTPTDSRDLLVALTEIDKKLSKKYPERFQKRALVGCSMGAYLTLYLASQEKTAPAELLHFDRYVAINPPVTLRHGIVKVDQFQHAPLSWPESVRQWRIDNAVHKVAKLNTLPPEKLADLPFDRTESQSLIGMTFRLTLRDVIFSSQYRNNMGVLKTPLNKWSRDAAYDEIYTLSFDDYFSRFVLPYYGSKGITPKHFDRVGSLKHYTASLSGNPKVRVMTNQNDFLLAPGDIGWLRSTFGNSRTTVFPYGGHMGNLGSAPVQQTLIKSLSGL